MLEYLEKELNIEYTSRKVWYYGNSMANGKKITEEELYLFLEYNCEELFEGYGRFSLGFLRLWRNIKDECKSDRVKEIILHYFGIEKKLEEVNLEDIFGTIDKNKKNGSWYLVDLFGKNYDDKDWKIVIEKYPNLWYLIPPEHFKEEEVKKRILENPALFEYYPHGVSNYEEIKEILLKRGDSLEPQREAKRKQIEEMNKSYESVLEYVRKTGELYCVDEKNKTYELCIEAIKRGWDDYGVPKEVIKEADTLELYRKNGYLHVLKEGYDKKNKIFRAFVLISKRDTYRINNLKRNIQSYKGSFDAARKAFDLDDNEHFVDYKTDIFEDYLKVLGGKIVGNYRNCEFEGIQLNNCDISEAIINKKVLKREKMETDKLYLSIKKNSGQLAKKETTTEVGFHSERQRIKNTDRKIFYISDIHLDHKILDKFKKGESEGVIKNFILGIVKQLTENIENGELVIVLGDVSSNYSVVEYFYRQLKEELSNSKIIAILGNHELWIDDNYDSVIKKYRTMFDGLGIQLLQNDLLLKKRGCFQLIEEKILEKVKEEELISYCKDSELLIYGGTGFAAYSKKYTALDGLYSNCIDGEEELYLTEKFNKIYKKICKVAIKRKVIVATHNPKEDYSLDDYNKNVIYLSGHTHINVYNPQVNLYADNQIGYIGKINSFKYLYYSEVYDIFADYEDGIYEISKNQYLDFNRGKGVNMSYSRREGAIYMLKRNGIYMFLLNKKDKLYILNGGKIGKLINQDMDYYYRNMINYSDAINKNMDIYNKAMEQISLQVRAFGGSGLIHGCIVDIDYWNHIYLNPVDGKATPYSATSMTEKKVYSNVKTLLRDNNTKLYSKYLSYVNDSEKNELTVKGNNIEAVEEKSTLMYKPSRLFKEIQYLTEKNIIRKWLDDIMIENELIGNSK